MNDCLVVGTDGRRVVQNHHLGLELPDRSWLKLAIDEHHTLAEVVPLELLLLDLSLDREADRLTGVGLIHVDSLVMDTFDLHRVELSLLVGSKKQRLIGYDSTREKCSCNDNTDTSHLVETVN